MCERKLDLESALFTKLDSLGIRTETHRHPPVFTVSESKTIRGRIPGEHCKSLFLKDKHKNLWLIVASEERKVDLKLIAKKLKIGRLSFCAPELVCKVLGVEPGAVTPFALINEASSVVNVVLDKTMLKSDKLNYHPSHNEATTTIKSQDFLSFLNSCDQKPLIIELLPDN